MLNGTPRPNADSDNSMLLQEEELVKRGDHRLQRRDEVEIELARTHEQRIFEPCNSAFPMSAATFSPE